MSCIPYGNGIGGIFMSIKKANLYRLTLVSMFVAIMLVMNFTPLGYISTGMFSITLMTIPVALGAACAGMLGGTILGFVFGLSSFLQAFGIGFMVDPMAATLFNENAVYYTLTCFVPRLTVGFLSGYIFHLFEKHGKINIFAFLSSAAVVPVLNTLLFMSFYAFFYKYSILGGASVMSVVFSALTINFVIEFAVTLISASAINQIIYKTVKGLRK